MKEVIRVIFNGILTILWGCLHIFLVKCVDIFRDFLFFLQHLFNKDIAAVVYVILIMMIPYGIVIWLYRKIKDYFIARKRKYL